MTETPMGRSVRFEKGYDARAKSTPGRTYGVHGMQIRFLYRGEAGAVQFTMATDWIPWEPRPVSDRPELWGPRYENRSETPARIFPMACDLGYHSLTEQYEDQGLQQDSCPFIGNQPCYYDGSGLNAEPVMVALIYDGEEAMWELIEAYYQQVFEKHAAHVD